ncbi:MAG: proprotein convertase P-domain-containing protein [Saprospiraceae bacterium]|nr:proprotein convertase P-domain-containing protein [Saprospiraceae bacterium]
MRGLLILCLLPLSLGAQQWNSIAPDHLSETLEAMDARPQDYAAYRYFAAAEDQISTYKSESPSDAFDLPCPDGSLVKVTLKVHSNFAKGLAARYPGITTHIVKGTDLEGYLSTGPSGMNGVFHYQGKEFYLDAIQHQGQPYQIAYYTADVAVDPWVRSMHGTHEHFSNEVTPLIQHPRTSPFSRSAATVSLRTYDLALACTGEYAARHGGTKEGALEAMNVALTRINSILESELAIRLRLFEDNDDLLFLDSATDPYTNGSAGAMANENNAYLAANVITTKYDLGHVFGTDCGNIVGTSGGIGTVCGTNKGFGSSCEIVSNDRFYIGIVCHELGHQFGAEHTWNNCPTAPDNQFNAGTAFEPGSGSTIMSYAGACAAQNIAFSEDFYYHNNSLTAIQFFVENGARNCAETSVLDNTPPTVRSLVQGGFYIPIRTPFRLTATGSDPDGDTLSYCWEQYDAGIGSAAMSPIAEPVGNGPIFRSFEPSASAERIFPALSKVLAGNFDDTEVLPTYSRDLTFRVTARDQQLGGGSFAWDEVEFEATEEAGPFVLTSFFRRDTIRRGDFLDIEWDVANTDQAPVNCQRVNIKMSADAGNTFPFDLALDVANDGHEQILIPDTLTPLVRFMVEAADNIFFDINEARTIIAEARAPGIAWNLYPRRASVCVPGTSELNLESFATLDFDGLGELVVLDAPSSVNLNLPETIRGGDSPLISAAYGEDANLGLDSIVLGLIVDGDTSRRTVLIDAVLNDFSDQSIVGPINGASNQNIRPEFSWIPSNFAEQYILELDKNPSFPDPITADGLLNRYTPAELLDQSSLYYWRIIPENSCGPGMPSDIQSFHTVTQSCAEQSGMEVPINLSQSQTPTVQSKITIGQSGTVSDVNVKNISGFHEGFGDVTMRLISPAGTAVTLVSRQCGFSNRQFALTFDDDAPGALSCQFNFSNAIFQPSDSLSRFNGEEIQGDWILEVSDSMVGSGGRIDQWQLEVCGSIAPTNPLLSIDTLRTEVGGMAILSPQELMASSTSVDAGELRYTLVTLPTAGEVRKNGELLVVGNQFSQRDVDEGLMAYHHLLDLPSRDAFSFTLVDQLGGWQPITQFPIAIRESSTNVDDRLQRVWEMYPNPSGGHLRIDVDPSVQVLHTQVFDLHGKLILQSPWKDASESMQMDLTPVPEGMYMIVLTTRTGRSAKRLVVSR